MRKEINYLGLKELSMKEFWIIGFSVGFLFLISRIIFPNNALIGGLAPVLGLFIGYEIVKIIRNHKYHVTFKKIKK